MHSDTETANNWPITGPVIQAEHMDVEDAVAHLYSLPLDEFVAARNALVKQAKSEGAAQEASRIQALGKPTVAAWLVNQVARAHLAEMDELVALGERMREAAAGHDGRRLRALTSERSTLINKLMKHARTLARESGQRLSDETAQMIGDTLHAAMADPRAADAVRAGCLTRTLQHFGYGSVEGDGTSADVISLADVRTARAQRAEKTPQRATRTTEPATDATDTRSRRERDRERRRREAEEQVAAAESAIVTATTLIDELTVELDDRKQELADAESEVERLAAALDDARQRVKDARAGIRQGDADLDKAQGAVERARRERRGAQRQLDQIGD